MSRHHICPGGCGKRVPIHLLACSTDWWALPDDIRRRVNVANSRRQIDPRGHMDAVAEAVQWYRNRRAAGPLDEGSEEGE